MTRHPVPPWSHIQLSMSLPRVLHDLPVCAFLEGLMMREKLIYNRTEIRLLPFLCEQKKLQPWVQHNSTCDLPKACISSSLRKDCWYKLWHLANSLNAISAFSDTSFACGSICGSYLLAMSIIEWQRVSVFSGWNINDKIQIVQV